ncbi:Wzz/FepE/Etk N-terminal domain-containing protein [Rhodobacteraceae bacterium]|nr:Wzz/FepE/Etk N-terminal domain-containing protein [Paracoccaceae bacterium]
MTEVRPSYDDEIDLFELFATLWEGKWKIITTTVVAALLGIILTFALPNSYNISTPFQRGKQTVFLPYISLNELLKAQDLLSDSNANSNGFRFDSASAFNLFVTEFNDYEEMLGVISENEMVQTLVADLSEVDKQKSLIEFAKLFKIIPPSKDKTDWVLSVEWHDDVEGVQLFRKAIEQTLFNVQSSTKQSVDLLAAAIENRNAIKLENLRNELILIKAKERDRTNKRLQFLMEQSEIAKELGIETNRLDSNALSDSSQNGISLSVSSNDVPFYLRGYKAIDKELSLIQNRTEEETLLMANGYIEVQEKIVSLENDLSASQLRAISDLIQKDNPNDWVEFDLALADVKPQKKPALYVALSILLGGVFGATYVLISNAARKRKETTKSA